LRDPDDDMVLECAVASGSQYLVTHNIRDFSGSANWGSPQSHLHLFLHC